MHEEKAPFSGPIIALLLGSVVLLGIASILSFAGIYNSTEASGVLALTTAIIAAASWSFFNMRFRVTAEGVGASMFPFSHRVAYDNIGEVHVIDKIPWYVGWGLRIWKRRLAFVSMHKSAVAVEKKKGIFKTLVMTTSDPEKFIEIIESKKQ
ncbi:MAG: hypothetical protein ACYS1A_18415 [Planctomycetota bacterium]|jgi:hypothetical protein